MLNSAKFKISLLWQAPEPSFSLGELLMHELKQTKKKNSEGEKSLFESPFVEKSAVGSEFDELKGI